MKDSIQQNGGEVAIVIYDSPLPPKYFRFSKKFIRTLFVVVPVILTILLIALFLWGLAVRLKDSPAPHLPQVLTESDSKFMALESEMKGLRESNAQMAEKLSAAPATTTTEDPFLMAIKRPYGMQNLLSQNKVNLDQFELVKDQNKVGLKFQIISSSPETKVTGHVLVFMLSATGIMAYPTDANTTLSQGIKFSEGEPFSVSRLRPTNAEFNHRPTGESVKFMIYIFSREGDLLLIKETESFNVGAKS